MKWIRSLKLIEKRKLCNLFTNKTTLKKLVPKFLSWELEAGIDSESELDKSPVSQKLSGDSDTVYSKKKRKKRRKWKRRGK